MKISVDIDKAFAIFTQEDTDNDKRLPKMILGPKNLF
jgi:hypothetical protein